MATNYPGSLDAFTNPTSSNTLDSPSHSLQHSDLNDAVEAIETKLGVGTATPGTATAYYPLVAGTAGATSWTQLTYQGITAGSATSGQVLTAGTAGTTTWSTLPVSGGLIQVVPTSVAVGSGSGSVDANGKITFTTVSSISINSCFTSTYDNYKIIFDSLIGSANVILGLRWRKSGTDNSGATYYSGTHFTNWSGVAGVNTSTAAGTSANLLYLATTRGKLILEISQPLSRPMVTGMAMMAGPEDRGHYLSSYMNNTDTYDGVTFLPASGTITGTARIYGYKN